MITAPRLHVAAVPRLSLFDVRHNVEAGRSNVIWLDERNVIVGQAEASITDDRLQIAWLFRNYERRGYNIRKSTFDLIPASERTLTGENYTLCPVCSQIVFKLLCVRERWACRKCHQVYARSELISHVARQSGRLDHLNRVVGAGRPKGMHERTYQRLRDEKKHLEIEVGEKPISPRATYASEVSARWLSGVLPTLQESRTLRPVEVAGPRASGSLLLTGDRLFSGEPLLAHLEGRLRAQAKAVHQQLATTRRRVSGLQVRRAMTVTDIPPAASITPEPVIKIIGRLADGRFYAEHHSAVTGDHELLDMMIDGRMPNPLARAIVEPGVMIIGVVFEEGDRTFVPALVQTQIDDVEAALALQRGVLERYRKHQADHVRAAVKEYMAQLSSGVVYVGERQHG